MSSTAFTTARSGAPTVDGHYHSAVDPFTAIAPDVATACVCECIRSLYLDRIKPEIGTIKKRLEEMYPREFAGRITDSSLVAFVKQLNMSQRCESSASTECPILSLITECDAKGRPQQLALFKADEFSNRRYIPTNFLGFVDPMDPDESFYSPTIFAELAEYIEGLAATRDSERYTFPGGRYGAARALHSIRLPCLANRSLGELCHIVQLMINKNIVAYGKQGTVVPFRLSLSAVKAANAKHMRATLVGPASDTFHTASDELPLIETPQQLIQVFESILFPESLSPSPRTLLLSNVKAEIRERFGLELSETKLGFTKLVDLVQTPPLSDGVCQLAWRKNNPIILPHDDMIRRGEPLSRELLPSRPNWIGPTEGGRYVNSGRGAYLGRQRQRGHMNGVQALCMVSPYGQQMPVTPLASVPQMAVLPHIPQIAVVQPGIMQSATVQASQSGPHQGNPSLAVPLGNGQFDGFRPPVFPVSLDQMGFVVQQHASQQHAQHQQGQQQTQLGFSIPASAPQVAAAAVSGVSSSQRPVEPSYQHLPGMFVNPPAGVTVANAVGVHRQRVHGLQANAHLVGNPLCRPNCAFVHPSQQFGLPVSMNMQMAFAADGSSTSATIANREASEQSATSEFNHVHPQVLTSSPTRQSPILGSRPSGHVSHEQTGAEQKDAFTRFPPVEQSTATTQRHENSFHAA